MKNFITNNNIKTVVDLGCGDFKCGELIYDDLDIKYTGYDTYKKMIDYNLKQHSMPKYFFEHLNFFDNKEKSVFTCCEKGIPKQWYLYIPYMKFPKIQYDRILEIINQCDR